MSELLITYNLNNGNGQFVIKCDGVEAFREDVSNYKTKVTVTNPRLYEVLCSQKYKKCLIEVDDQNTTTEKESYKQVEIIDSYQNVFDGMRETFESNVGQLQTKDKSGSEQSMLCIKFEIKKIDMEKNVPPQDMEEYVPKQNMIKRIASAVFGGVWNLAKAPFASCRRVGK